MKRLIWLPLLAFCAGTPARAQSDNEPRKILEKQGVEYAYPHWSNDGRQILFQSNESGKWQIYRMDEDGKHIVQLTSDASNNNFIDWAPDNKAICFVSDRTGNEEVFVMDVDGNNQKQLTNHPARDIHPYWSPKGDRIFFNSTRENAGAFEIYEMKPDGSEVKRITHSSDDETCARLSPSGQNLVYLKNNNHGLDDVFVMNLRDSSEQNITNNAGTNGWPCWMPDGNEILYSGIEDGHYKLFMTNLADKSVKRITNPRAPQFDARPNVSKDGKKIVFNRQVNGAKNTIAIYVLEL